MIPKHVTTAAITALALALGLSACAGTAPAVAPTEAPTTSTSAPSDSDGERGSFNDQDVMFAQMMSVHHSGAMSMSQVVLNKEGIDPDVAALAQRIMDAQGPEIAIMNQWLEEWGKADAPMDDMAGMDHSTMDLSELEDAEGDQASRLFLEQMIEHHQGAVDMSQTEIDAGANLEAIALAEKIIEDQQAEIELMEQMLSEL